MSNKKDRLIGLMKTAQAEFGDKFLVYAIPEIMSKKFIAYCSMSEDMKLILEYISLLRTKPLHTIESSLSYSLISLYGKCFTDASKNSYPKLESNIFAGKADLLKTHEYLMDLRHQFIAHRGNTESEIGVAFMLIPKDKDDTQTQIQFLQVKQKSFSDEDLDKFETLMKFITDWLAEKIQKSGEKLRDGFFNSFTPEEISAMLLNNAK
ncbi:hypothetical protein [Flavobacterium sp.]|uniref:hypothetical protein n=1 Tax=Flavobacterium sp. TaxID=239 RepID=UPI002FDA53A0